LVLLIEAQDGRDPYKPAHWAHHASYVWTRHRLPTALLIMCADTATARWAEPPVCGGSAQPNSLVLSPFVAGPHNVPLITDPAAIRADPALATLSVLMHPADPSIGTALHTLSSALRDVPDRLASALTDLTALGVRDHPARHVWKDLVKAVVLEEVLEQERVERLTKYRSEHLLLLLGERELIVSEDVRRRIKGCHDPEPLLRWLLRALTASSADEIFEGE
jgi:hypothetical protein